MGFAQPPMTGAMGPQPMMVSVCVWLGRGWIYVLCVCVCLVIAAQNEWIFQG